MLTLAGHQISAMTGFPDNGALPRVFIGLMLAQHAGYLEQAAP